MPSEKQNIPKVQVTVFISTHEKKPQNHDLKNKKRTLCPSSVFSNSTPQGSTKGDEEKKQKPCTVDVSHPALLDKHQREKQIKL